jgi:hypothetical protein
MNMSTKQADNLTSSLIKLTRNGQITLPAEVRKALQVKEVTILRPNLLPEQYSSNQFPWLIGQKPTASSRKSSAVFDILAQNLDLLSKRS